MLSGLSRKQRLILTICISCAFFIAEISIGFYTHSLAVIADAFHYLNDLVGFFVALIALVVSERKDSPDNLSFGWQRAQLLGGFFNGVFLLALGVSIFLQSIQRFITLERIENPKLVLIIGCVGLVLNVLSAIVLHEHEHPEVSKDAADTIIDLTTESPHAEHRHVLTFQQPRTGHDIGMLGVLIHVIGDAVNNIGVIISALVIWLAHYDGRFYADPGVSMGIAIMILLSSIPLVKQSGIILLQGVPTGLDLADVRHDLEKIAGIDSIHELHVWQLSQKISVATAHVVMSESTITQFMEKAKTITECLHSYGVHSVTLQPEVRESVTSSDNEGLDTGTFRTKSSHAPLCHIDCGDNCGGLTCCT